MFSIFQSICCLNLEPLVVSNGSTVNFNFCLSALLLTMCWPSSLFIFVLPLFQFIVHFTFFLSSNV